MKNSALTLFVGGALSLISVLPAAAQLTAPAKWTNTGTGKTYVYVPMTEPELVINHVATTSKS